MARSSIQALQNLKTPRWKVTLRSLFAFGPLCVVAVIVSVAAGCSSLTPENIANHARQVAKVLNPVGATQPSSSPEIGTSEPSSPTEASAPRSTPTEASTPRLSPREEGGKAHLAIFLGSGSKAGLPGGGAPADVTINDISSFGATSAAGEMYVVASTIVEREDSRGRKIKGAGPEAYYAGKPGALSFCCCGGSATVYPHLSLPGGRLIGKKRLPGVGDGTDYRDAIVAFGPNASETELYISPPGRQVELLASDGDSFIFQMTSSDSKQVIHIANADGKFETIWSHGMEVPGFPKQVTAGGVAVDEWMSIRSGVVTFRASIDSPSGDVQGVWCWRAGELTLLARHPAFSGDDGPEVGMSWGKPSILADGTVLVGLRRQKEGFLAVSEPNSDSPTYLNFPDFISKVATSEHSYIGDDFAVIGHPNEGGVIENYVASKLKPGTKNAQHLPGTVLYKSGEGLTVLPAADRPGLLERAREVKVQRGETPIGANGFMYLFARNSLMAADLVTFQPLLSWDDEVDLGDGEAVSIDKDNNRYMGNGNSGELSPIIIDKDTVVACVRTNGSFVAPASNALILLTRE